MDVKKYAGHGGKREGAGRPPVLSRQVKEARKLAEKLNVAVKLGLDPLADRYNDIVLVLVNEALGLDDTGKRVKKPNTNVAMKLMETGIKLMGGDRDEAGSKIEGLLERIANRPTVAVGIQNSVGGNSNGSSGSVEDGTDSRTIEGDFQPIS